MQQRRERSGRWTVLGLPFGVAALVAVPGVALASGTYGWEVYTSISGTVSITEPQADAVACVDQEVSFAVEAGTWADTDRRREVGEQ